MPRQPRRSSPSGIHHVVVRGINKEDICLEVQDYRYFQSLLRKYKNEIHYDLYSYCLMSNHAHFLINPKNNTIGMVMNKILVSFSMYHNAKYNRSGHLFQNRFFSEPVDSEHSFLAVLKYIVYNPVKAGICGSPSDYPWCSFNAYLGNDDNLTDTGKLLTYFPNFTELTDFLLSTPEEENDISEYLPRVKYTDEEVRKLAKDIIGCASPAEFRDLSRSHRNHCIKELRKMNIPIRQIGRITGFGKNTISSACQG